MGTGISRWTMAHFYTAIACFLIAQGLMLAGFVYPAAPLLAPQTLVAVHLLTIGWLSLLMFGALYQFVPVLTSRPLLSQRIPLVTLVIILIGLTGMLVGFLGLAGVIGGSHASHFLPLGGGLVVGGVTLGAGFVLTMLWPARPLGLPARYVAAGQGFLLVTVGLGLTFSLALVLPSAPAWLTALLARHLHVHILAGLVGWFGLTALGVSFRLLSMFMLAPDEETTAGTWSFRLAAGGMLLFLLVELAAPDAYILVLRGIAAAVVGVGLVLYLVEMRRLYRRRQRRLLELNSQAAAGALTALAIAIVLAVALALLGRLDQDAGPLGYLVLFGWLSGLGLTQLYKIVPFLTWLEKISPKLGRGRLPRVQDLVVESRARPWFVLYFAGVGLGTVAGLLDQPLAWRGAVALHLLATLGLAREFWRTRHVDIAALTASIVATPPPRPFGAALPQSLTSPKNGAR